MTGLREALEKLARDLRSDAANHGADIRHPRLVLENRAAEADRILAAHPAEPAPVASPKRFRLAWLSARRRASLAARAFHAEAAASRELEAEARPPVASREAVGQAIEQAASDVDLAKYFLPGTTDRFVDALLAAGVFRDEAEVKAEALRDAAEAWDQADADGSIGDFADQHYHAGLNLPSIWLHHRAGTS